MQIARDSMESRRREWASVKLLWICCITNPQHLDKLFYNEMHYINLRYVLLAYLLYLHVKMLWICWIVVQQKVRET